MFFFFLPLSDLTAPIDQVRFLVNFTASTGSWLSECCLGFFCIAFKQTVHVREECCPLFKK